MCMHGAWILANNVHPLHPLPMRMAMLLTVLLLASCCMRTYALECCTGTRSGGGLGALTLRGDVTESSGGGGERSMVLITADVEGEADDVEGAVEEQPEPSASERVRGP
jgi:hypothetical protein